MNISEAVGNFLHGLKDLHGEQIMVVIIVATMLTILLMNWFSFRAHAKLRREMLEAMKVTQANVLASEKQMQENLLASEKQMQEYVIALRAQRDETLQLELEILKLEKEKAEREAVTANNGRNRVSGQLE